MPDSPQRPAQIEGGPVPGERGAASLVPFGLDQPKPRHYRQALRAAWDLRDEPFFAWDSLAHGVCDACALGSQGLRDAGLPGWHVCPPRLDRLRGLCAPPLAPADLLDIRRLRGLSADALRGLGRLPYPFLYEAGARGFTRVPWELAVDRVSESLAGFDPDSCAWALGAQHLCDEASYVIAKSARALGCPHVDLDSGPAWRAARVPYQQTEAFRFGNPTVDDWEGKVNAWPLDEGLIDYVDGGLYGEASDLNAFYTANIIADPVLRVGGQSVDATVIDGVYPGCRRRGYALTALARALVTRTARRSCRAPRACSPRTPSASCRARRSLRTASRSCRR